jgi:hypothetical protein
MSNERITHIDRPYPTTCGQKLTPKPSGGKTGGQGFWDVLR